MPPTPIQPAKLRLRDSGIKLRQLRNFIAVLEAGSLRRAAEMLGLTEPALSKSIRQLEGLLQVPLLDRGPRGMRATAYGELLAVHARTACNELDQAVEGLGELHGNTRGIVRVGTGPSCAMIELPQAIVRFQARCPDVRIVVREGLSYELVPQILQGELDFAIVSAEPDVADPDLMMQPLVASEVRIVARQGHPLAGAAELPPTALIGARWLLPPRKDTVRMNFERNHARLKLGELNVVAESSSLLLILSLLSSTDYLAVVPVAATTLFAFGDKRFSVLNVGGFSWHRQFSLVRRARVTLPPGATMLIRELKSICAALSPNVA
jgi:DNA-binding transcriptional LysR family regulator